MLHAKVDARVLFLSFNLHVSDLLFWLVLETSNYWSLFLALAKKLFCFSLAFFLSEVFYFRPLYSWEDFQL